MRIAVVSGSRTPQPMGMENAERQLISTAQRLARDVSVEFRIVGGRSSRRYARAVAGRWIPSHPQVLPRRASWGADLVHMLALDLKPPARVPYVLTMHDLSGMHFSDEEPLPPWTGTAIRRAERVITPSQASAEEIAAVFDVGNDKLRVVANGPGQVLTLDTPPLGEAELSALGIRRPFVMRMGGYTARKNVPVLLAAWQRIRAETGACLVLAGPPHPVRDEYLAAAPTRDGVVALDYVPAQMLMGLLRAASALVSTSTYEGFGLPPLEAMRGGVPVVAVRSRTVEEVCGEAALFVENKSDVLASAVVRLLRDPALRNHLVANGTRRAKDFTWEAAADDLLAVYRELGPASAGRDGVRAR